MINSKGIKRIKENVFVSIISSLVTVLIVTIIGSINKADIIRFLGGVTKSELKGIMIPSQIIDSDCITEGVFINNPFPIENQFAQNVKDKNIKRQMEVITKQLELKQDAVIIISAFAKCKYTPTKKNPLDAHVISKIYLDNIECAKDSSFSNGLPDTLFSSSTFIKKLEPGKHQIKVEGVFYGYAENPHIDAVMRYVIFKYTGTPIIDLNTGDKTAAYIKSKTQPGEVKCKMRFFDLDNKKTTIESKNLNINTK